MVDDDPYSVFHRQAEPLLRVALVAAYGTQRGREAAVDALVYGWEHWERIRVMENPIGYLYRVGSRRTRRLLSRRQVVFAQLTPHDEPWVEPGLPSALDRLSPGQRQAVVLVHAYGHSFREAARVLGVAPSTIQNHCDRGMRKLRSALGVNADV